jgi:sialic acid synthase SpsE
MRNQNRKVDGPDQALSFESHGTGMEMVSQIRNQKQGRGGARREHADAVRRSVSCSDKSITG